jgi:nucleoside-diphosphate-sugar epimerase
LPEDDPRQRCPDIGLAERLLNWQPRVHLREGLMQTIDYFGKLLSDERGAPV